ncbi:hypothetical protein BT69DRAFT_1288187 [Atractiella rhizophila]|nr:hypothetical protein BT69DRAFT_1290023 [Atractiella rhizophila]KAH8915965.1 hypothetical protein BT69DRAFT_1288187 [Atractiella rhizophila]
MFGYDQEGLRAGAEGAMVASELKIYNSYNYHLKQEKKGVEGKRDFRSCVDLFWTAFGGLT